MGDFDILAAMSGKQEFEIGLTDDELTEIHNKAMNVLPSNPGTIVKISIASMLPENPPDFLKKTVSSIRKFILPDHENPDIVLPELGTKLAEAVIPLSKDPLYIPNEEIARMIMSFSFYKRALSAAAQDRHIDIKRYQSKTNNPLGSRVEAGGKILAVAFLDDFTPIHSRTVLQTIAEEIDKPLHPGRDELREAMEAVREKYESE